MNDNTKTVPPPDRKAVRESESNAPRVRPGTSDHSRDVVRPSQDRYVGGHDEDWRNK